MILMRFRRYVFGGNRQVRKSMKRAHTISVDGASSGKRAACAAVLALDGKIVDEISCALLHVDGYVIAAEIAGVALAGELVGDEIAQRELIVKVDNPEVVRVIEQDNRPKQYSRIPEAVLEAAIGFWRIHNVRFSVHPRNSMAGVRRAHRLAS